MYKWLPKSFEADVNKVTHWINKLRVIDANLLGEKHTNK